MKKNKIAMLSLAAVMSVSVASFAGTALTANAAASSTSNVFTASSGATLGETENGYIQFNFTDESAVTYKQDLALNWYESAGVASNLNMQFNFGNKDFDSFEITFEGAQYNKTADEKSVNTVVFENEEGALTVSVNDGTAQSFEGGYVDLSLESVGSGKYNVSINDTVYGQFENIAGNYFEYASTSASTPMVPLTFTANGVDAQTKIEFLALNGQSFVLDDEGNVIDNAAPVVVLKSELKSFILGYALDVDYEVIDVIDATPVATAYYKQYGVTYEDGEYKKYSSNAYIFENEVGSEEEYVRLYVSVENDTATAADDEPVNVYLDWYVNAEDLVEKNGENYLAVRRDFEGPAYVCVVNDSENKVSYLNEENAEYLAYQAAVEAASKTVDENGNEVSIPVGSGNYFYLPSLENLIVDNNTDYTSLKFNIYYKTQGGSSVQSAIGKSYDSLEIELTEAGLYVFKVIATDKTGNAIYCYENGRLIKITGTNVFDFDAIPTFYFTVYNRGASIEAPKSINDGYVGITYSVEKFTVKALSGYHSEYALYYFDNASYMEETGAENYPADLKTNPSAYAEYFIEINEYDSSLEEDEGDNVYDWSSSSLSFKPAEQGYYIVKMVVVDSELWGESVDSYQVIHVGTQADSVYGESDWLENNWVSVMFFAIALVAFIATVLVWIFVRPEEENSLDGIETLEITE